MRWSVSAGDPRTTAGDLLVLPVLEKNGDADLEPVLKHFGWGHALAAAIRRGGFRGKTGTFLAIHSPDVKAGWLLFVGHGKADGLSLEGLRRAAALSAKQARAMQAGTVLAMPLTIETGFDPSSVARCWVEGAEMALAPAGSMKPAGAEERRPNTWRLLVDAKEHLGAVRQGMAAGRVSAAGCLEARRLVNLPPNVLTPRQLAVEAKGLAERLGLKCAVLGRAQLRKLKLGGLLGVGQGSPNEPVLICLETRAAPRNAPCVALVGKGVTFDTGGISLKPGAKMDQMKCDMAGAAAVFGAALIVAERRLPVRLVAVAPAAENMPDGGALRPADILTLGGGKTVEVLNTDAEGRLILADALHWVCRKRPDYVIDIATLTGACALALGQDFAGVMGTSGDLIQALEQAGGETGERIWPLPLIDAHREALKSKVADLKNLGPREGGALTAAAFLSHFVPEDIPWAHVDIAGPAWAEQDGLLGSRGATGFGARLLARTVEILAG